MRPKATRHTVTIERIQHIDVCIEIDPDTGAGRQHYPLRLRSHRLTAAELAEAIDLARAEADND